MINEEYLRILTGTLKFEKSEKAIIIFWFALAIVVLSIVIVKQFKKAKRSDKITMVFVAVAFCVAFCWYIISYNSFKQKIITDISANEFATYTGEFIHDRYQRDSFFHDIFIYDDNKKSSLIYPDYGNMYKIRSTDRYLPLGDSEGTLIYGKNSRVVVDWKLE